MLWKYLIYSHCYALCVRWKHKRVINDYSISSLTLIACYCFVFFFTFLTLRNKWNKCLYMPILWSFINTNDWPIITETFICGWSRQIDVISVGMYKVTFQCLLLLIIFFFKKNINKTIKKLYTRLFSPYCMFVWKQVCLVNYCRDFHLQSVTPYLPHKVKTQLNCKLVPFPFEKSCRNEQTISFFHN